MATITLKRNIGNLHFEAELPRASTKKDAVEARYLLSFDQWITRKVCEFGEPSPDGLKFLRERDRLRATDFAELIGVVPETISRWENGKTEIPGSAWELVVTLAEQRIAGRTDTLDALRERHRKRRSAPRSLAMPRSEMGRDASGP
jgi:DNA-binding transcriptional regulator YiaG